MKKRKKLEKQRQELSRKKRKKPARSSVLIRKIEEVEESQDFGGLPERGFDHLLGCGG